ALLATVEARAREQEARAVALDAAETAARERAAELQSRLDDVTERERGLLARERALDKEARERARAYLLEAAKRSRPRSVRRVRRWTRRRPNRRGAWWRKRSKKPKTAVRRSGG